jgi:hypothetical protein
LWYSGHDDCYVAVESTDRAVPVAILGRLLALLAGSALAGDAPVEVRDPAGVAVESLINDSYHWIGVLDTVSQNAVAVNLSATSEPWRLGRPHPERVDRTAVYDVADGTWRLTAPYRHS